MRLHGGTSVIMAHWPFRIAALWRRRWTVKSPRPLRIGRFQIAGWSIRQHREPQRWRLAVVERDH
jgi:hypothetical protein